MFVGLQVIALGLQVTEAKKKAEEEAENVLQLEESRKKLLKVSSVCAVYSLLQSSLPRTHFPVGTWLVNSGSCDQCSKLCNWDSMIVVVALLGEVIVVQ